MPNAKRRAGKPSLAKVANTHAERVGGRSTPSERMAQKSGKALPSPHRSSKGK